MEDAIATMQLFQLVQNDYENRRDHVLVQTRRQNMSRRMPSHGRTSYYDFDDNDPNDYDEYNYGDSYKYDGCEQHFTDSD